MHALYGFARYADEIVDDLASTLTNDEKAEQLNAWGQSFLDKFESGETDDPVCLAVLDTVRRWNIPRAHFEAFLHSMTMDLTITEYQTYEDLYEYVYGSAAVIGLQMVPILEPSDPAAYSHATDLERGRVYLPLQELAKFGVTRADLEKRIATPAIKEAIKFQIARVRQLEQSSRAGIAMLGEKSQPCIETARVLYCGIVDAVIDIDYEVFDKRASVSLMRRLRVAIPAYLNARKLW